MITELQTSLKNRFGFDQFRTGQEQTIQQLLEGKSSLAIFPTGSGKSLCYQLTALHLPNITLVVSPLLALMKDQLNFLNAKGIAAASIDSTLSYEQNQQVMNDLRDGKIKILMVSVERFKNERFRRFIQSVPVSMLVVDEAHCISEWGHNFRPDYLKLPVYRKDLNIPLTLLLTATATRKVKRDMAAKFNIEETQIVQTGFYRANLDLSVLPVTKSEKNSQLVQFIQNQNGPGIVYVTLQKSAEQVAQYLCQNDINASAYHAGFQSEKRQQIQHDFMSGKTQVVVATIAFGMGIDKSDIRFVTHYDLPKSIENYSQEIGRAGRDGQLSKCLTLANLDNINTVENFVFGDTPELTGIEFVLGRIREECQNGQWEVQLMSLSNDSNIRQLPLKTLLVQLELLKIVEPTFSYFADVNYKFIEPKENILGKFSGERQKFLSAVFENSQFRKIWGSPNFDAIYQASSSDRARVITALEYLETQNLIELETKRTTDVYAINESLLRDNSLAENLHQHFSDKEQKEIKRIASLVRFFELDRCLTHNLSLYFDDQQSPENCGHCSVCRGQVAKLAYSQPSPWPGDSELKSAMVLLDEKLSKFSPLSEATYCRFLAGMSVPVFSRNKVRQIPGFGSCEHLRYEEILQKIRQLMGL